MDLPVLPLHKFPEYTMQCCELINDEWKRSTTARLHSLKNSCDTLPTNLILLQENKVIGHCKLSLIPTIGDACFIESVVIERNLRGHGYGKYLMAKAEDYCRQINLKTIYLSTKDKELFYKKIGYTSCQPVSIYGDSSIFQLHNNCSIKYSNKTDVNIKNPAPPMPKLLTTFGTNRKIYMNKVL